MECSVITTSPEGVAPKWVDSTQGENRSIRLYFKASLANTTCVSE